MVDEVAFPPVPVVVDTRGDRARQAPFLLRDAGELPCAMCGSPVVEYRRRRICLHCGFMTGRSQGIE